jgi:hypothetical protein
MVQICTMISSNTLSYNFWGAQVLFSNVLEVGIVCTSGDSSALMQSAIQSPQLLSNEPPLNLPFWSSLKLWRSQKFASSNQ